MVDEEMKKSTKLILDRFTKMDISRQRKYQLRHANTGKCLMCSRKAVSTTLCLKHLINGRERARVVNGCQRRYRQSPSYQTKSRKAA